MAKNPTSKGKSSKKTAPAVSDGRSAVIELASRPDDDRIRERAYGIWIEEGRPDGRDLAHWQRAWHELQYKAA